MPIELKKKSAAKADEAADKATGLTLFQEDSDELTLPGETIASFLDTCDYTAVAESSEATPYLILDEGDDDEGEEGGEEAEGDEGGEEAADDADGEGEEAEGEDEESADEDATCEAILPGIVAARLVDEDDLVDMFGHYLDEVASEIDESDEAQLQERAALACFADHRDEEGGIAEESREEVAGMLRAVLEGSMIAVEVSEKILTKSQRNKAARIRKKPKSGKVRAQLKKRKREEGRGAKKAKIARQHKMRNRRKASRVKQLARESTEENVLVFGFGEGIDGANYRVGLAEAPNMEFDEDTIEVLDAQLGENHFADFDAEDLDEKKKMPEAFKKKMKGKKGDDDEDDDKDDKGKKDETSKDESRRGSPFAAPVGRPSLDEGASLSGRTLASMGIGRKTALTEDEE